MFFFLFADLPNSLTQTPPKIVCTLKSETIRIHPCVMQRLTQPYVTVLLKTKDFLQIYIQTLKWVDGWLGGLIIHPVG